MSTIKKPPLPSFASSLQRLLPPRAIGIQVRLLTDRTDPVTSSLGLIVICSATSGISKKVSEGTQSEGATGTCSDIRMVSRAIIPQGNCAFCPLESDLEVMVVRQEIVQVLHQEAVGESRHQHLRTRLWILHANLLVLVSGDVVDSLGKSVVHE